MQTWVVWGLHGAGLVVVQLVLLVLGKLLLKAALRMEMDEVLFEEDNPAVGIVAAGYYAGLGAVLWASLHGAEANRLLDVLYTLLYGGLGVLLLGGSLALAQRVLLPRFSIRDELLRDRNAGTGVVLAGAALASGLVAASAMMGNAPGGLVGGLGSMVGAFVLGQLSLGLLSRMHRLVARFDVHAEIERDNVAAGCTLAGAFLGNGIVLAWGLKGDLDPSHLRSSFLPLAQAIGASIVLLPTVRLVVSRVLFNGIPFDKEIAVDRNVAAGAIEMLAHPVLALVALGLLG